MIGTNIVKGKDLRKVQQETLSIIKDSLVNTFGPNGSTTNIKRSTSEFARPTKDGHTVLSNIKFNGMIETTVVQELTELTTHIVKTVGDGTTSSIILSSIIFNKLVKEEIDAHPSEIIRNFKKAVELIFKHIKEKQGQEPTLEDIYNIALISTNNNETIANDLVDIYRDFGNGVFIDVGTSNDENTKIKYYNGTTLKAGFLDPVMITNQAKGTAELPKPDIFIFRDPIDTPELVNLFHSIINKNIFEPIRETHNLNSCRNTVIMAPRISSDLTQFLSEVATAMHNTKYPLLIITDIYNEDVYEDLIHLTGAKPINKYIDANLRKIDIENGNAPTIDNIISFAGTTDLISADATSTKFIRPKNMYVGDTMEFTQEFNNLILSLEAELKGLVESNASIAKTGRLKRRINALKSNMVELLIGGVSIADRESVRDLVEDAVKSLRSACEYGVGQGSNFEAFKAAKTEFENSKDGEELHKYIEIIYEAYKELLQTLYISSGFSEEEIKDIFEKIESEDKVFNIRTKECDGKVLTSIKSDEVILSSVVKIITIMYTTNQFLLPDPVHNKYSLD